MAYSQHGWNNSYNGDYTTKELWKLYEERMFNYGFDSLLVYTYSLTPVRSVEATQEVVGGTKQLNANNLSYVMGGNVDTEVINQIAMNQSMVKRDPLAFHARTKGTIALVGPDFVTKDDENYQDTIDFFEAAFPICQSQAALCIPLQDLNPFTPHGFGLHTKNDPNEILKIVADKFADIILDCINFSKFFDTAVRREIAENIGITRRQLEIIEMVSMGLNNAEIANLRSISEPTVSFHLKAIQERLNLHTTREIPIAAARLGLVDIS